MDAIIPAAGKASRMRGIPKFLLPCDSEYTTLIEIHIASLLEICKTVWIPTRPELVLLLDSLSLAKDRVIILPMQTENMTQTILKTVDISKADHFQLVMPDTFFVGQKPYRTLNPNPYLVDLALWEIRPDQKGKLGQVEFDGEQAVSIQDKKLDCDFNHAWGALTFHRELMRFSNSEDPHIGYSVNNALKSGKNVSVKVIEGEYYDCGTPSEYLSMLDKVLLQ
jgi:dTDP-glucose pyrophosphorylase